MDFIDTISMGILVAVVIWILKDFLGRGKAPKLPPVDPKPPIELKDFTLEELKKYNGENGNNIYIGVNGKVYDVTPAAGFYGPGGSYHLFAGRDATRALALASFEEEHLNNPTIDGLTTSDLETLDGWVETYEFKYDHVGFII
eukprot:TRINITY_DN298_c0_g1_i1.p1 TRINITY_DN298_c0_g1~~TRINITY_DN298_c0_g1_i1.p1  ORF type:complete len:143 (-),score=41.81 TRINITY_DN298_c0_g1_i1:30-458(-)